MIYVIIWLVCGAIAAHLYQQRGQSQATGFLGGLLLGPIGVILALLSPNKLPKCPHCAERIQPDAKICKHCKQPVPESFHQSASRRPIPHKPSASGLAISEYAWIPQVAFGVIALVVIMLGLLWPVLPHLF